MTRFQETKLESIELRWEISSRNSMLAQEDIYHLISHIMP